MSPFPDPLAWDEDALSMSWEGIWGVCVSTNAHHSPSPEQDSVRGLHDIVSCPSTSGGGLVQPVIETGSSGTRSLPPVRTLLTQPQSGICHRLPESLALHAWLLSRVPCKLRDFQRGLPLASSDQLESPLDRSMTLSGRSLWIGVVNRSLIHSVPLFLS